VLSGLPLPMPPGGFMSTPVHLMCLVLYRLPVTVGPSASLTAVMIVRPAAGGVSAPALISSAVRLMADKDDSVFR
jgi:hypothetical protein